MSPTISPDMYEQMCRALAEGDEDWRVCIWRKSSRGPQADKKLSAMGESQEQKNFLRNVASRTSKERHQPWCRWSATGVRSLFLKQQSASLPLDGGPSSIRVRHATCIGLAFHPQCEKRKSQGNQAAKSSHVSSDYPKSGVESIELSVESLIMREAQHVSALLH
jgi:hypothetical protein